LRHVGKGSSLQAEFGPTGLFVALVAIDVVARLAVPVSLLALASGATRMAALAAVLVSALAVVRGVLGGRHAERVVNHGWQLLTRAAATRPTSDLSTRSPLGQPHPVMEAAFHSVEAIASVLPKLTADAIGLLIVTLYVLIALGPKWLLFGVAILPFVVVAMIAARRGFRREETKSFDHFAELAQELDALLRAAEEIRAQAREHDVAARVTHQASALAASQRRAATFSAWLGLLPLGLILLGASASLWQGALQAEVAELARVAIAGGAAVAFLLSAMRGVEAWVRSEPRRAAFAEFVQQAGPSMTDAPTTATWRDPIHFDGVGVVHPGAEHLTPSPVTFDWATPGLAVIGDNGAGKTTLALALLGLVPVSEGRISSSQEDLTPEQLAGLRRRVVFVPQAPYTAPSRSVRWHLELVGQPPVDERAMRKALEHVGLLEVLERHCVGEHDADPLDIAAGELSAGERRLLELSRAFLSNDAELFVFDEPEASLDSAHRDAVRRWLQALASPERRVLLIAHDRSIIPNDFDTIECRAGSLPERSARTSRSVEAKPR
jgi:ABC-type multidrug transport system fused ATPase/permease subunit